MKHPFILAPFLFLAAATLHAQSFLDVQPGFSSDRAISTMQRQYRITDTLTFTRPGYDLVIRMAPVRLAGYDGWLAIHTDSTAQVTSISWSRAPWYFFGNGDERWQAFTDWKTWGEPTRDDAEIIFTRLDSVFKRKGLHTGGMIAANVHIGDVEDNESNSSNDSEKAQYFREKQWSNDRETVSLSYPGPLIIVTRRFVVR